jgi:hypothetical protein
MRGDVGAMVGLPSWVRETPTWISPAGVPTTVGADEGLLGVVLVVGPLLGTSVKVSDGAWDSTTSVWLAVGVEVAGSSSTTRMLGVALASELVGVDETEFVGESVACSVTVGLSVATSVGLAVV